MAFATVDDVQAILPARTWDAGASPEPSVATCEEWLDQDGNWILLQLSGCEGFDFLDPVAVSVLRDVNAGLTAARIRDFKFPDADAQERYADIVRAEAKEKLAALATACGGQELPEGEGAFRSLEVEPYFRMERQQW